MKIFNRIQFKKKLTTKIKNNQPADVVDFYKMLVKYKKKHPEFDLVGIMKRLNYQNEVKIKKKCRLI